MEKAMNNILIVGQTPPPYGGAAMMIERTINGDYGDEICIFHVRLNFSKEMNDIGLFQLKKIFHALSIVKQIYKYKFRYKIHTIYYFPAGPKIVPILRDIIILGLTRPLFDRTIFHFRAAGLSEYLRSLPMFLNKLMIKTYFKPEVGIRLSPYTPDDAKYIKATKEYIVYNGIEDHGRGRRQKLDANRCINLLFIGILQKSKGVSILLEACAKLYSSEVNFKCHILGEFQSAEYKNSCLEYVNLESLGNNVIFHGVKLDEEKYKIMQECDIFVFPTHFESEGTPGVIIEAMSFSIPIVSTIWRGVPSLVEHGKNGLLSEINNSDEIFKNILFFIQNPNELILYGMNGRKKYLDQFNLETYYRKMGEIFKLR
jgi:glycosyltransferase involved in cell wall biosynthesis